MKHILRAALALSAAFVANASAEIYGNRTFLAHRDELSNVGMKWAINNHHQPKDGVKGLGATLTATPFYKQTNNTAQEDIARLFGMGLKGSDAKGQIVLQKGSNYGTNRVTNLSGLEVDHSPNSLSNNTTTGVTPQTTQVPMFGTVNLKPFRSAWGVRLDWSQDLSHVMKGLSLHVALPIEQVSTRTVELGSNSSFADNTASAAPAKDGGAGKGLVDYFTGGLEKTISGDNKHVNQTALKNMKLSHKYVSSTAIADVSAQLRMQLASTKRYSAGVSATLVIPTGTTVSSTYAFEPVAGNRGHIAVGAALDGSFHLFNKKGVDLSLTAQADWRYFVKGAEKRCLGVDFINGTIPVEQAHYRMGMQHTLSGVFPLANVLVTNVDVKPGHQFDGVIGVSGSWKNFTFDLGYNLFAKEKEAVAFKDAWTNDTYAFAHDQYSMSTAVLGAQGALGGIQVDDTDYNDPSAPVTKHSHKIGSNHDAFQNYGLDVGMASAETFYYNGTNAEVTSADAVTSKQTVIAGGATDMRYPSAYVSRGGPIQESGKLNSDLNALSATVVSSTNSGVQTKLTDKTLEPWHEVSTAAAVTQAQLTHSIVGGVSYKLSGKLPIIIGLGGQYEIADTSRNSALGGWQVWGKVGVSF